ncbi:GNAT family N-acetyltransferase [Nocardia uniformis]|uniref:GNAT family N-acetyltransferase n=1 Tax=Nocardia uniformis TaxID=53432 RepID=A0A849CBX5_9NOCA|nr:GNAT family N-acetyltransferase [Nocardia uniformis]NNH72439.1 GNAT family N-acetyltransferase [Nocardia uniformis]
MRAVSRMLARAFEDDPQARWMHPRPESRSKQLRISFERSFRESCGTSDGVDLAVDDAGEIVGSALWIASPRMRVKATLGDRIGMWRAYGSRTRQAVDAAHLVWSSHVPEPHWHLLAIATAGEVRGRGYGEALMNSGLSRCRADGLPAHLETGKPENIPYYQRFGFEVIATIDLPHGGPRNWLMRYGP